jgi:sterol desaturase/sphingolipid hydroxylase (fatty acid hydroxylase superfamily)
MDELSIQSFPQINLIENWLEIYGQGMLILTIAEIFLDLLTKKKRNYWQTAANYSIDLLLTLFSAIPFIYFSDYILFWLSKFSIIKIEVNWWTIIISILVADFIYYWMHRNEHRIKILWGLHSIHHSSTDYDLSLQFRLAWLDMLVAYSLFFIPMVLLGFHPVQTLFASEFILTYQIWIHTERIGKLGIFDLFLNTPSNHRVHHGSNPQYIDKNYGAVLIIWDKLFGTYQAEEEKVIYGLTENINTYSPIKINFFEYWRIWSYIRKSQNSHEIVKSIFGSPEWKPKAMQQFLD